jgi:ankyrin repeat protein
VPPLTNIDVLILVEIAKKLVEARPTLAREENNSHMTPMDFAAFENKISVLTVLLQHDFSLGYAVSTSGSTYLDAAAGHGHVDVAREILKHCPDAPYLNRDGTTCLHTAINNGQEEFVEFVMQSKQLQKLINMRDNDGDTALHYAICQCKPKIVAALLRHQDRDVTMLNDEGNPPVWVPSEAVQHAKTLNWVRMHACSPHC